VERVVLSFYTTVGDAWPRAIPLEPDQVLGEGTTSMRGEFAFVDQVSGRQFTFGAFISKEGDEGEEVIHGCLTSLSFSLA